MDAGQLGWFKKTSSESIPPQSPSVLSGQSATDAAGKGASAVSYLSQLDGVRFIAVALVLFDHWMAERITLPYGALGVTIFFVLSGFLITRILLNSKDKLAGREDGLNRYLKTFYIRRTLRIFPLYYLSILILAVADVPPVRDTLGWCLLYATNLYIGLKQTWMGTIDHFWSLAVEEQVYLLFPLLLFFVPRRHFLLTMGILILGSTAYRLVLHFQDTPWMVSYVMTPACLDSFGLGGLLAYLWLYHRGFFFRLFNNSGWLIASVVLLLAVYALQKTYTETHNIMTDVWERSAGSILGFFLIGRAAVGFEGWMKWFLENPVSRYLGQISYGIYIFHNLVFNVYHTPATHPTVRIWNKVVSLVPLVNDYYILKFFYFFGLTVMLASLSWFLVEKPINALKDRFSY